MKNKLFSLNIEYLEHDAYCRLRLFGLKISIKVRKYLFNKYFCKLMGVKNILFIRTDGIGDFIFDIPYMKYIKSSSKYKDYKLILAGTQQMVDIAKIYINQYVDEYIVISDFKDNLRDIKKYFKKMYFKVLINPVDAKMNTTLEYIAKIANAEEKICHYGFFARNDIKKSSKEITRVIKNYTKRIDTGEGVVFVKERARLFFELLLEENIPYGENLDELVESLPDLRSEYILISPFARFKYRTYGWNNFVKIIDFVTDKLNIPVLILGSPAEFERAQKIKNNCIKPDMVYNIAGKLTFSEVIMYTKYAKLLIANETGTVHIAQNHKTPTVCISNGSFMNTFQPYPVNESYVTYVYPENINDYIKEKGLEGREFHYNINKIDYNDVINRICGILNVNKNCKETV